MMLLEGKTLLVTGVLMDTSIAFHVAKPGAGAGCDGDPHLVRPDDEDHPDDRQAAARDPGSSSSTSANQEHLDTLADRLREHTDHLDGVLHSIGFAPQGAFTFLEASGRTSHRGPDLGLLLKALAVAALPLMGAGGSDRRADLRRELRLAGLRLDGRGQGRLRVDQPLPAPATSGRSASAATSSPPARSARRPPSRSPASRSSRRSGTSRAPSAGTSTTRCRPPRRASRCSPTGSRRRPARSSTSTAASTPWAADPRWLTCRSRASGQLRGRRRYAVQRVGFLDLLSGDPEEEEHRHPGRER
jgi:hypothetical protein